MTGNAPILPKVDPVSYLRTYVPLAWGSLLAFLGSKLPFVADALAFVDGQFGDGWRHLTGALATAAVIAGFYWAARQIGRRWPAAEKWLIGSSSVPVYFVRGKDI